MSFYLVEELDWMSVDTHQTISLEKTRLLSRPGAITGSVVKQKYGAYEKYGQSVNHKCSYKLSGSSSNHHSNYTGDGLLYIGVKNQAY